MGRDGGPIRSGDLDRATDALRGSQTPPGPPAHLVEATLATLRNGVRPAPVSHFKRIRNMNFIAKIAAAFVLAVCGAAVLMWVTRGTGQSPQADRRRIQVSPPVEPPGSPNGHPTDVARGTDGVPAQPVKSTAPAVAQQPDSPPPAPAPPPPGRQPVAQEQPPAPPAPAAGVRNDAITGVVRLDGKPPKRQPVASIAAVKECAAMHHDPLLDETVVADDAGNLANVVVFLTGANLPHGPIPKEPAVLEQKGCQYIPHVLDVTVGQTIEAKNDDGFLHNVHTLPEDNPPSNIAQPTKQRDPLKPVKVAEVFKVKCDVHPWMSAWIYAFDHPYHATSTDDGVFEIPTAGLPDGRYAIAAWHEKYKQSAPQVVTITGGKPDKPITFTFKP